MMQEITQRLLWNNSVAKHLKLCSREARSQIQMQISFNQDRVKELLLAMKPEKRKPDGMDT